MVSSVTLNWCCIWRIIHRVWILTRIDARFRSRFAWFRSSSARLSRLTSLASTSLCLASSFRFRLRFPAFHAYASALLYKADINHKKRCRQTKRHDAPLDEGEVEVWGFSVSIKSEKGGKGKKKGGQVAGE